jgi:ubiquinone/menaquinone biosynthesis C-methylase UbiE
MQRIPEPELMNEPSQVHAYATADFEQPHNHFIEQFRKRFGDHLSGTILDLGCGPCDISLRFAKAYPGCELVAVDGAANMLAAAAHAIRQDKLQDRIRLVQAMLPAEVIPAADYSAIISNSLLHHLHDPLVIWNTIQQHTKSGTHIFIMDLMRPESRQHAESLVQTYAADEPEILQHDFFHSLLAAFSVNEVQQQLQQAQLDYLETDIISDRHFIIYGTTP